MSHYVYMIECQNGSYYTGYSTDVARRYAMHVAGHASCRYTRAFPPKRLLAQWAFVSRQAALSAEYQIKRLSRAQKNQLLADHAAFPDIFKHEIAD